MVSMTTSDLFLFSLNFAPDVGLCILSVLCNLFISGKGVGGTFRGQVRTAWPTMKNGSVCLFFKLLLRHNITLTYLYTSSVRFHDLVRVSHLTKINHFSDTGRCIDTRQDFSFCLWDFIERDFQSFQNVGFYRKSFISSP